MDERRIRQHTEIDFLQRHWPLFMRNQYRIASDPSQPRDNILRILHAAAEQKQLGLRRRERQRQFVVHAADWIGDHLIFVDDEELRTVAAEKTGTLRLERRDQNFSV